jgi:fatty-acid desaturase
MIGITLYCFGMYLLGGFGASLGYHRILTHRSADMPKWFEYLIVTLGLPMGTPVQWAGNHRAHHRYTDKEGDPHSPHLKGFWFAHCGWYFNSTNVVLCILYALAGPVRMFIDSVMRPNTNQEHVHLAKDIQADKYYAFVSQPLVYTVLVWIYLTIITIVPYLLFGWVGVLASSLTLVFIYNIGDGVDSIGHLFGKKVGESEARNNLLLGYLTFGDGWHANHHARPRRAQHGIQQHQFDLSHLTLRFLKKIRIVNKIY